MLPRLTLLFLCDPAEQHSLFVSALEAADFQLVTAHYEVHAKRILFGRRVDAIVIHHPGIQEISSLTDTLKRLALQTPVFRLGNGIRGPQPGVDAVCHADLQDEVLAHAVARFLRQSLAGESMTRETRARSREAGFLAARAGQQVAV